MYFFNITLHTLFYFYFYSAVTTCKRDLVDYNICLKHALQEAWPRFVKGFPEFDFPSLDPLVYKTGKIEINSSEIRAVANFSNLIVIGLSQARFSNVRTYLFDNVFRFEMDGQIPSLFVEGSAKVNGTINVFKIIDEGHANLTLKDAKTTCNLTGHVVNDTWIVEHFRISPSFGNFKIHVTSIFEE
ncbi:PREDICTED: uncharacterized protein LOC105460754, partial [Wasmannia auropunctata]|uniref:uncharacterized protein LOC105460754 n=1 Tax=Wasmannia auropunctata TaxID=64793 RepID=UPI0005EEF436